MKKYLDRYTVYHLPMNGQEIVCMPVNGEAHYEEPGFSHGFVHLAHPKNGVKLGFCGIDYFEQYAQRLCTWEQYLDLGPTKSLAELEQKYGLEKTAGAPRYEPVFIMGHDEPVDVPPARTVYLPAEGRFVRGPLTARLDGQGVSIERRPRPGWDEYFMAIAVVVATRSSCNRRAIGTVLTRDNRVLATGYNGAVSGEPECLEVGCDVVDDHCQRSLHSETNAVAYAARYGVSLAGCTAYIAGSWPCYACAKLLVAVGCRQVVCHDAYTKDERVSGLLARRGIEFITISSA